MKIASSGNWGRKWEGVERKKMVHLTTEIDREKGNKL